MHDNAVSEFCLPRIAFAEEGVAGYVTVEVSVFVQQILGDLHTQLRIDVGEQNRLCGEQAKHPTTEAAFLSRQRIVHPQTERQGDTYL